MNKREVTFILNDQTVTLNVDPGSTLLDVLRGQVNMTGTKKGCGKGECGACTLILDGEAVNACLVPILKVQGRNVQTIEGIGDENNLHPLQESFMDKGAIQCGFCTPGMIMSSKALLDKTSVPTREEIREAIAGNICRCTGYVKIEEAVRDAVEKLSK